MIALTINVSEAEYIEAQRYQHRTSRGKLIRQRIQLAFVCIVSIYAVYELAKNTAAAFEFLFALLTPVSLLVGIILGCFRNPPLHAAYEKAAITLNGGSVEIDSDSYRWNTPGQSNGVIYWPAFTSWAETRNTITLVRGGLLYILPKSAFTEESSSELRALCLDKIGPEQTSRSIPS